MIGALTEFASELRTIGLPVSMVEVMDAGQALRHTDLVDREAVRTALAATMVKNARHQTAFDTVFDVYFGLRAPPGTVGEPGAAAPDGDQRTAGDAGQDSSAQGGRGGGAPDVDELVASLVEALGSGDDASLRALVRSAVDRLSGFQPGRPVGGRYYLYRVMHRLDAGRIRDLLREAMEDQTSEDGEFGDRIADDRAAASVEHLREAVQDEILRRLVADRGPEDVARTLRSPLAEDIDLMHATREEIDEISHLIGPLARKLASRLAARRRQGRKGRLDVRRTIRRSLAYGGALIDPRWRPRRTSKPELVLLCDVSGSMATFARFTMQLTYAIGNQFSNVRTFAFIDGIDEVTGFFGPGSDFAEALQRMGAEAELVRHDGHSDYGSALGLFAERFGDAITPRSTVIVTGDARNNYRQTGLEHLTAIAARARGLHWLNPESRRYWDTGDSVMSTYGTVVDEIHEVRTLRQLERFVERVALSDRTTRPVHLLTR